MVSISLIYLHAILGYLMCLATVAHPYIIHQNRKVAQEEKQDMPKCVTDDGHEGVCLLYTQCINGTIDSYGKINIQPKIAEINSCREKCSDFRNLPRRCCLNSREPVKLIMKPETFPSHEEQQAQFDKLPWSVALFGTKRTYPTQNKINGYICSGSLIHPKLVLSAVHCLIGQKASEVQALIGAYNFYGNNKSTQKIEVMTIIKHENYYEGNRNNDIALLVLKKATELNENVRTVYLANKDSLVSESAECYASVWGKDINGVYPSTLTKIQKKLRDFEHCKRDVASKTNVNLPENSFCAISLNPDKCAADSGSPLICKAKNTTDIYIQYGVMSFSSCRNNIIPSVYADVRLYKSWIDREVKQLGYDTSTYSIHIHDENFYTFV